MAIFHLSVKNITRNKGKTAVGALCYRCGLKAENLYDGVTHDYRNKGWISYTETLLPPYVAEARPEYKDASTLWNAVELFEKSSDARLSTEVEISLPKEMTLEQQKALVQEFVQENFVSQGRCVTVAIHSPPVRDDLNRPIDKDGIPTDDPQKMVFNNPHAHVMLTCRPLDEQGQWEQKAEIEYLCKKGSEVRAFTPTEFKTAKAEGWAKQFKYRDPTTKETMWLTQAEALDRGFDNCNRTSRQPKTTPYGRQNETMAHWSDSARITEWRKSWEGICNRHLKEAGIDARIDSRSLDAQGREGEIADVYLGAEVNMMKRRRERLIREGKDPKSIPKTDREKWADTVREHNQSVREQKASKVAVRRKLEAVSQKSNSINGDIHMLQGTASSMARAVSESANSQNDKEAELRESVDTLDTIIRLNTASLELINRLMGKLSSLSMFQTSERTTIQEQIQSERQKVADREAYAVSLKQKCRGIDAEVVKGREDLQRSEIAYANVKMKLDTKISEYEGLISEIPEEYKQELSQIMTVPTENIQQVKKDRYL